MVTRPLPMPGSRRNALLPIIGQLAGELARLAVKVPRGGMAVAQDAWNGFVWGARHGYHAGCGDPPGCLHACHHVTVACYPMLPHGGGCTCGRH